MATAITDYINEQVLLSCIEGLFFPEINTNEMRKVRYSLALKMTRWQHDQHDQQKIYKLQEKRKNNHCTECETMFLEYCDNWQSRHSPEFTGGECINIANVSFDKPENIKEDMSRWFVRVRQALENKEIKTANEKYAKWENLIYQGTDTVQKKYMRSLLADHLHVGFHWLEGNRGVGDAYGWPLWLMDLSLIGKEYITDEARRKMEEELITSMDAIMAIICAHMWLYVMGANPRRRILTASGLLEADTMNGIKMFDDTFSEIEHGNKAKWVQLIESIGFLKDKGRHYTNAMTTKWEKLVTRYPRVMDLADCNENLCVAARLLARQWVDRIDQRFYTNRARVFLGDQYNPDVHTKEMAMQRINDIGSLQKKDYIRMHWGITYIKHRISRGIIDARYDIP